MSFDRRFASTADAKKAVKVESVALQNILSLDQTAYCLQIKLPVNCHILSTNETPPLHNTADFVSS